MKRVMFVVFSLLLTPSLFADAGAKLIPAGALVSCTTGDGRISSKTTAVGDPVLCKVQFRRGDFMLPYGSYLGGQFADYKDPGHFVGKGWMELDFDRLYVGDQVLPISAKIADVPGYKIDAQGHILGKGHAVRTGLARVFQSDPSRTHMTGFSQGGYMTWRFLCKHADRFASVAPGGAGLPVCGTTEFFDSCAFDATASPSRQIDVLFMAGRQDGVVPFSCQSQERDLAIAAWGLTQSSVIAMDATYTRTRYANAQGTVMETLEHDYTTDPQGLLAANKGHCYPGSNAHTGTPYDQLACVPPNAFAWGAEVMGFFVQHPKK